MFTTCIHCTKSLGANEVLEQFPVGNRLAFDPRLGRLWVVCRHCERWNLSPLDTRWEAIEAAERLFRDARLRVSTDNIGLARLRAGLDLIRIGEPLRPEMAAWRYGDQFGRRRRRQLLMTTGVIAGAATAVGGLVWAGMTSAFFMFGWNSGTFDRFVNGDPTDVVARIPGPDNRMLFVQRAQARMAKLQKHSESGVLALALQHKTGEVVLHGPEAIRVATQLLPVVNRFGGSRRRVQQSVALLEHHGSAEAFIRHLTDAHGVTTRVPRFAQAQPRYDGSSAYYWAHSPTHRESLDVFRMRGVLHAVPAEQRLALEMALHEERERRAMDGELQELENAWRDAEAIANIADNMFVGDALATRIDALKSRSTG